VQTDKASLLQRAISMRLAELALVLGSALAACTTGSSSPGGKPGGTVDATLGPPSESGAVQLGITCSTFFSAKGTFVPDTANPPPTGFTGCWPVGAWSFTLTVNTDTTSGGGVDTCATAGMEPTPLAKYQFTGTTSLDQDGDPQQSFKYNAQPSDPNVHTTIKVTEGGSGICQGSLSLYDSTGTKVWTLQPEQNADNSITGGAEFDLYTTDQWGGSGS
jgi:hypothetical protein